MTGKPEAAAQTAVSFPSPSLKPPSIRLSKRIKHAAEYLALRLVAAALRPLPRAQALAAGRAIGRLIHRALPSRAEISRRNILASLPGTTIEQADAITRKCWENLGAGAAEFVQLPDMTREDVASLSELEGLEHLRRSYAAGKGALIVTAHYGAWELGAKVWPFAGFQTAVVARRVKNPWVNDWVTRVRSCGGVKVILARDAVRESLRWLKQGNLLCILIDHRVTEGGLKIPFLGRPASTTGLPALLALRYGIPVHMAHCWREGTRVRIRVDPVFDFAGLTAKDEDIAEATLRMNAVVESWVRERPEAWLWIHNRWKITD